MRGAGLTKGPTTRIGPSGRSVSITSPSGQCAVGEADGSERSRPPPVSKKSTSAARPAPRTTRRRATSPTASRKPARRSPTVEAPVPGEDWSAGEDHHQSAQGEKGAEG